MTVNPQQGSTVAVCDLHCRIAVFYSNPIAMSLVDDPKFTQLKIAGLLPTPKGVAMQVIKLTQQSDASNQAIAHLISADPALSVRVIKAANVLLANSSRPVVTISDAVMVLGARGLRQLVLGISLIVDYRHGPCKQFDYPHFWTHSLLTGIAIKHLAQFTRLASADEVFVAGLFSHIGQLALATVYSEAYGALLARTKGSSVAQLHALQQQEFGFDEAQLGEAILADMNFPKVFQMLVRYCDQPENNQLIESSRDWRLLHLMHLAKLFADLILSKPAMTNPLAAKIKQQSRLLIITDEKIAEIGDDCARDWKEWSALLGMNQDCSVRPFAELLASAIDNQTVLSAVNDASASLSLRVLVVEDDATMLKLLQAMLHTAGYNVLVAKNGLEAMGMIKQHQPQLVVSDLMMPEMDGITLCRHLRASEQGRNIYIVILTAQENPEKLIEAFEAGADDYLLKPIMPKIFFARMRAAQRVIQMQAELAFEHEQLQRLANELKEANQHLQKLASTDVLTGLPNRRAAMERLDQEWSLARRSKRTLACMILDIDHFKSINDKFGHPVGDLALKSIAQVLRLASRTQDMVCRFGGEEFLVICPDTDIESAYQCAERLRVQVAAMKLADIKPNLQMTISIGISVLKTEMVAMDELLTRADKCLYAAKQAGRNRIIFDK